MSKKGSAEDAFECDVNKNWLASVLLDGLDVSIVKSKTDEMVWRLWKLNPCQLNSDEAPRLVLHRGQLALDIPLTPNYDHVNNLLHKY